MSVMNKLEEKFTKLPGIGPRQAKRFVQFLLTCSDGFIEELAGLLSELKKETGRCESCFRFFARNSNPELTLCPICADPERDVGILMVVARDVDIETIEYSGVYEGLYFVLGGVLPILTQKPEEKIRVNDLQGIIQKRGKEGMLREVVLALPANPDGDNTVQYVRETLSPLAEEYGFRISTLGRGLSTGLELEYSDGETIRNALHNRK